MTAAKPPRRTVEEFKTADGAALAFSVPKGGGTAVLEFPRQDALRAHGARCPTDHFKSPLLAKSPLASEIAEFDVASVGGLAVQLAELARALIRTRDVARLSPIATAGPAAQLA